MRRLLLTVLLSAPSASFAAPCAVPIIDTQAAAGRAPRTVEAGSPLCAKALVAYRAYAQLRVIGRVRDEHAIFQVLLQGENNAYYRQNPNRIMVTEGLLLNSSDEQIRVTVAHELGHAMQQRDGVAGSTRVQREAHADVLAAELLARAGYPLDTARRGRENRHGCAVVTDASRTPGPEYPTPGQRWRNTVAASAAYETIRLGRVEAAAFDGRGSRAVPWPSIGDITPDGVFHAGAHVRRSLEVRAQPRLGLPETSLRAPGQSVPQGRVVVADVPVPLGGGRRVTVTRRILNPREYAAALAHNRAVREAAANLEAFSAGGAAAALTGRLCGINELNYRGLVGFARDGAVAAARRLTRTGT
jgi:hypothetical protein